MITKLQLHISCVRSILLFNSCKWQPNIASLRKLENVQRKAIKWICGLNEYKISIASIKLLPICYQLIYSDFVLFCNNLQNNYDIKVEDYVTFIFLDLAIALHTRLCSMFRKCAKLQHGGHTLSGQLLMPTSCQQNMGLTFARRNSPVRRENSVNYF